MKMQPICDLVTSRGLVASVSEEKRAGGTADKRLRLTVELNCGNGLEDEAGRENLRGFMLTAAMQLQLLADSGKNWTLADSVLDCQCDKCKAKTVRQRKSRRGTVC